MEQERKEPLGEDEIYRLNHSLTRGIKLEFSNDIEVFSGAMNIASMESSTYVEHLPTLSELLLTRLTSLSLPTVPV